MLPDPADQHGDIRALAAAIRMQLVQHDEPQGGGLLYEWLVLPACEDQLQHDVVGEKDVRWIVQDLLPVIVVFLAGVPLEADGPSRFFLAEEFLQFSDLAVGKSVHRVDDDGLHALAASRPQHVVNDGDHVGQALAGPGAGREDVAGSGPRGAYGTILMRMEAHGHAAGLLVFRGAED